MVTRSIKPAQALFYGSLLGLLGFLTLALGTNGLTFYIGAIGWVSYVVIYGLAKRRTIYSTLIGSISGAIPPLAGYTTVSGRIDKASIIFFLILICWQMAHFYAIAIFRLRDYKAAGLPVWPAKRGISSTKSQILFFIVAFIAACWLLTFYGYTGYIYLLAMTTLGLIWLWRGVHGLRSENDTQWGRQMFGFSLVVMMTMSVIIPLGAILP